ncbi:MAG: hypothetical protein K6F34_04435 [Lachnospiraceae bacterium]|nr:hypothetical protein [Lachnospiraceae bacterium]
MGILNIFKKGKKDAREDELDELKDERFGEFDDGIVGEVEHGGPSGSSVKDEDKDAPVKCSFVMGVLGVKPVPDTGNIAVSGNIKGNVTPNMIIGAVNFGDDDRQAVMTTITGIQVDEQMVDSATDTAVTLILEDAREYDIGIGTVLYTRDMGEDAIHDAYVGALGDAYVKERALRLTVEEMQHLSLTDCAEIWRLNTWYSNHAGKDEEEEVREERKKRLDKLIAAMCEKIIKADEIYYVHDKKTGEAHLFSQTIDKGDGSYICTPPNILIVTRAYRRHYRKLYGNDKLELAVVRNGDDKKGIGNFLAGNFYINGACGAAINVVQTSIAAGMLVKKPDHKGIPVTNIPVTNPDLVRWMLLIGQMDAPVDDKDDSALIFKLYYRFMGMEMTKAKLIIPMKHDGGAAEEAGGEKALEKDMKLGIATMKGKGDRDAVIMYTDWRRLRSEYGREWDGMIHTVGGLIGKFDCAVNPTRFPAAGVYVTGPMYESMVRMAGQEKKDD